jgi:hypothetical protein
MAGNLDTTNLLLGIMAAVSVLEALLLIGAGIALVMVYRRVMTVVDGAMTLANGLESRQIAPAMARVNAILDDMQSISAKVKAESEWVDHAIRSTVDRVDDTVVRVRSNVRAKTSWIVGAVRGLRAALEQVLQTDSRPHPPSAGAPERVM